TELEFVEATSKARVRLPVAAAPGEINVGRDPARLALTVTRPPALPPGLYSASLRLVGGKAVDPRALTIRVSAYEGVAYLVRPDGRRDRITTLSVVGLAGRPVRQRLAFGTIGGNRGATVGADIAAVTDPLTCLGGGRLPFR